MDRSLFGRVGGTQTLVRVHKIFYDKVYVHPWLGQYFTHKPQDLLESQQTDFMTQLMGGPSVFAGRLPKRAHQHMMITEELFDLRSRILSDSIAEAGVPDDLREAWLKADAALKGALVKTSVSGCVPTFRTEPILNFPKPVGGLRV